MMEHFYTEVLGWFDYEDIYTDAVKNAKDGDIFVEIGTAWGKSTTFMAVEIFNSGKKIEFHAVDIFPPENGAQEENLRNSLKQFDFVHIHKSDSLDFLRSITRADFVFLDGDHSENVLIQELFKSYHLLHSGGILAGHDYLNEGHPDVKPTVDLFCKMKRLEKEIIGTSFLIHKR